MGDRDENKWHLALLCFLLLIPFVVMFAVLIITGVKTETIFGILFALASALCLYRIGLVAPFNTRKNLNFTNKEVCIGILSLILLGIAIYLM